MSSPNRPHLVTFLAAIAALVAAPLAVVASDAFTDVPESNVHHDDITWLRDADVTRGCNPPDNTEFCPGEPVLRQQMASFMRRLAENQVVDAATATEADHAATADSAAQADHAAAADTVGGFTAADLGARAAFDAADDLPDQTGAQLSVQIEAPAPGVIVIDGSVEGRTNNVQADNRYSCSITVDGEQVTGSQMFSQLFGEAVDNSDELVNSDENCATGGATIVPEGTHTVDLSIGGTLGVSVNLGDGYLWAVWIPFDGTGATPQP